MKKWNPQIPDSVGEERWNQFEHTGRVEDYLNYVKARAAARAAKEEPDADHDGWDSNRYC